MSEIGTVIGLKDDGKTAVVSFNRTEACAKCRACMAGFSQSQMLLEAKNVPNAKKGDSVMIELPERGFFAASMIMYLLPLCAALFGFLAGGALSDILGFTLGIVLLLASYLIIRSNESRLKKLPIFLPYISEVTPAPASPAAAQAYSKASEPLK